MKTKIATLLTLLGVFIVLSSFMAKQEETPGFKNLKVLPKNTTHEALEKVMDGFKTGLGVRCNFCHAASKDNPAKMDFASDENHHKEIARNMMRMTAKLNKKYFNHAKKDGSIVNISCISCHNGKAEPQTIKIMP